MHRHHATTSTIVLSSSLLVGTFFIGSGCRNTFPESQVRMQAKPSASPDGIEEPPSRLYSAFGLGRSKAASQKQDPANDSSRDPRFASQASNVRQASAESSGTSFKFSDGSQSPGRESPPLTAEEKIILLEDFDSPELRRLAERRMTSLKARAKKDPAEGDIAGDAGRLASLERGEPTPPPTAANPEEFTMPELSYPNDVKPASAMSAEATPKTTTESTVATTIPAAPEAEINKESANGAEKSPAPDPLPNNDTALAKADKPTAANPISTGTSSTGTSSTGSSSTGSSVETPGEPTPPAPVSAEDAIVSVSDRTLLNELIRREEQRQSEAAAAGQSELAEVIRLRAYRLFAGGLEQATQPVEGWTLAEQEFLNYQTLALWHLIDPASHPVRERRWSTALPELRQASNYLAAATGNLHVQNLTFCQEVYNYGQVKSFDSDRFTAGQQVILYSEVENFVAERLSDGYETHLRGTYRILDAEGRRVAEQVLAEDQQTCRNYRRDYFLGYILNLPDRLKPGNYRFELTLEDVKGKKYGTASIPFDIVATN